MLKDFPLPHENIGKREGVAGKRAHVAEISYMTPQSREGVRTGTSSKRPRNTINLRSELLELTSTSSGILEVITLVLDRRGGDDILPLRNTPAVNTVTPVRYSSARVHKALDNGESGPTTKPMPQCNAADTPNAVGLGHVTKKGGKLRLLN
ncbi:hypothetical protein ACFPK9_10660 [Rubritalea spongiae]|uniref:Uncharacterized protein n=1 Tax=Rubritalea spongiae TaxID=430797 RepID=A0ABW5DZE1_9BACT